MTTTQTDSKEFSGKRALVTGGTKGMGEAIVRRLRLAGATAIITARSKPDELQWPELSFNPTSARLTAWTKW
jgi:NAD(P)-dependent dehydrogenase (short-subunit alcohol dehydrogenase family)